jgi:tripeptide aminopeptidase
MKVQERFFKYAAINTTSDEESATRPSTQCQLDLARQLAADMRDLGLRNVRISEYGYVYGYLPATPDYEDCPKLGFIAHMDTSPDAPGAGVKPQVWPDYDGGDLELKEGVTLGPDLFPHLAGLKGRTLVTSDGTTLLGADNKAGIAEILTACEIIVREKIPHGRICVAFTPDEEIGRGADNFDLAEFGADFAFTMDGGPEGELEYENFNAAEAAVEIKGVSVHPGTAKDIMVNALVVACELNSLLPAGQTPADTEGYEGFYFLRKLTGTVDAASMAYSLRDHDSGLLEQRKEKLRAIGQDLNRRYGAGTVEVEITDRYRNMADIIRQHFHLVESARQAMANLGLKPLITPMRGGTDGATLSYKGLPCPNLGTGGYAYHSVLEHITVEGMEKCTSLIVELARIYAQKSGV